MVCALNSGSSGPVLNLGQGHYALELMNLQTIDFTIINSIDPTLGSKSSFFHVTLLQKACSTALV